MEKAMSQELHTLYCFLGIMSVHAAPYKRWDMCKYVLEWLGGSDHFGLLGIGGG